MIFLLFHLCCMLSIYYTITMAAILLIRGFAAVAAPRYPFQSFFCRAEKSLPAGQAGIFTTIANPPL